MINRVRVGQLIIAKCEVSILPACTFDRVYFLVTVFFFSRLCGILPAPVSGPSAGEPTNAAVTATKSEMEGECNNHAAGGDFHATIKANEDYWPLKGSDNP